MKVTDVPTTGRFLDEIKNMGYKFAFQGGLSFSLGDIIIPAEKHDMIDAANKQVDAIMAIITWVLLPIMSDITR